MLTSSIDVNKVIDETVTDSGLWKYYTFILSDFSKTIINNPPSIEWGQYAKFDSEFDEDYINFNILDKFARRSVIQARFKQLQQFIDALFEILEGSMELFPACTPLKQFYEGKHHALTTI